MELARVKNSILCYKLEIAIGAVFGSWLGKSPFSHSQDINLKQPHNYSVTDSLFPFSCKQTVVRPTIYDPGSAAEATTRSSHELQQRALVSQLAEQALSSQSIILFPCFYRRISVSRWNNSKKYKVTDSLITSPLVLEVTSSVLLTHVDFLRKEVSPCRDSYYYVECQYPSRFWYVIIYKT